MKKIKNIFAAVKYAFMTIWRSDLRARALVNLLLTAMAIMGGIISILLGASPPAAMFCGFLAGTFWGYFVFNCMEVFYHERLREDFRQWSANHLAAELSRALLAHGIEGSVIVETGPPPASTPPSKMN